MLMDELGSVREREELRMTPAFWPEQEEECILHPEDSGSCRLGRKIRNLVLDIVS